ncbi:Myelin protein zero-like protein 1 [Merluccius polli]|uniref:Myelin protein zero-like protein 1 n=1 Tax=Merluccius polli TaxID=89951 RepID=A0AA47NQX6_MERPO|nr:Myelin protein zero-like protein 1 [Merluccius polli]
MENSFLGLEAEELIFVREKVDLAADTVEDEEQTKRTRPTLAVDIHAPAEVVVENGTTGVLKCFFKSKEVVSSSATVQWNIRQVGSDETPTIFYFSNGQTFPVLAFKNKVRFIGDLNRKDASIELLNAKFSDNGTYFCDVKNPPDVSGTPARTEVRVVAKESLPQDSTAVIVGAVCGAVIGIVLIAVVTYLIIKRHNTSHAYTGCTSVESASSQAPRPQKKAESSVEGSVGGRPSGPVQGPVIYAQLDHSSIKSPNSFHKMEPVVYADIRKN